MTNTRRKRKSTSFQAANLRKVRQGSNPAGPDRGINVHSRQLPKGLTQTYPTVDLGQTTRFAPGWLGWYRPNIAI